MSYSETDEFKSRINRIVGQLKGIQNMLSKDDPCLDVLTQISAVKSAVHRLGELVLEDHIKHCIEHAAENGTESLPELIAEFNKALERFLHRS